MNELEEIQKVDELELKKQFYQLYAINTAVHLLRPGAKWEIHNNHFSKWDDPRPCPSIEEVYETMQKIKNFEDSINTIWRKDQLDSLKKQGILNAKASINNKNIK